MESSILRALTDDAAVVTVRGEIDFCNAGELARCLCDAVAEWRPTLLQVDLAGASFIDSTGLGALLEGYRAAGDADARFLVVNPAPGFRRVLAVTGLEEFFGLTEAGEMRDDEAAQATGA